MGKESQPYVIEYLRVDIRRIADKNLSRYGEFAFPPESVECFSKSASNSYGTSGRNGVQLSDQSQSGLIVPQDTKANEMQKVPSSSFNPAVFRPLTLVPIKRVLDLPLAYEIGEHMAQPQRVKSP
jgi:hypothetical protein